jgi:sulfonate transport system substrate-binding protein
MVHTDNHKKWRRGRALIAGLLASVLAMGSAAASAADTVDFRVGWQKGSNLSVIKARGEFERRLGDQGVSVTWIEFPAGPQMLEGLNVGSIDFGVVGEAPPVFAQAAAGSALLYVGAEPPAPAAEALLVPADSPITSVADLKGKRVALNKGSNVHYFLVRALERAGLEYGDVEVAFLKPSDARAAFEKGAVEAWAIWDPYATATVAQVGAKILQSAEGIVDNYNFYIGTQAFAKDHPAVLKAALEIIKEEDLWIESHLDEAAAVVGPQIGLPNDVARQALANYSYGAGLVTEDVVVKQQELADVFTDLKLIPVKLDIASVVWRPGS